MRILVGQKRTARIFVGLVAILLTSLGSRAQTTTVALAGTVTDPNDAAIPSAQVKAVENSTGVAHQTQTSETRTYIPPALPPAIYAVAVSASGFSRANAITTLEPQQTQRLDLTLKVPPGFPTNEQMRHFRAMSAPRLSPDGKRV